MCHVLLCDSEKVNNLPHMTQVPGTEGTGTCMAESEPGALQCQADQ